MDISSSEDENEVITEACSPSKRVTMVVLYVYLHFYFFLPLIKDMMVLLPFSPFSTEVLKALNVVSFQLVPNSLVFIKAFEVVC